METQNIINKFWKGIWQTIGLWALFVVLNILLGVVLSFFLEPNSTPYLGLNLLFQGLIIGGFSFLTNSKIEVNLSEKTKGIKLLDILLIILLLMPPLLFYKDYDSSLNWDLKLYKSFVPIIDFCFVYYVLFRFIRNRTSFQNSLILLLSGGLLLDILGYLYNDLVYSEVFTEPWCFILIGLILSYLKILFVEKFPKLKHIMFLALGYSSIKLMVFYL